MENVAIANALQLEATGRRGSHTAISQLPIKISEIAIRFGDRDFLKENNNVVVKRRFHAVILTLKSNVCSRPGVTLIKLRNKFDRNLTIRSDTIDT